MSVADHIRAVRATLPEHVSLVCVSKFHPAAMLQEAYDAGERDFGESRVQELLDKHEALPKDIRWHFIGHLQTNKVRQIVPFISLIHSVDSLRLLDTIDAEAAKIDRVINVLLEVHVAKEESKSGFSLEEAEALAGIIELNHGPAFLREYPHVNILGLMGMATHTDDEEQIRKEFATLAGLHRRLFERGGVMSMGMSDDYQIAISEGSNMVRIGSTIFGERV